MPIKALVDEVVAQSANPDCIERELLESSLGIWRSRFGMKKGLEIWRRGLEKLWMEGKLMGPVRKLTLAEMEQD